MTLEEITQEFANDVRPAGPDGCSNKDRIAYVLKVFELETLDLGQEFDFEPVNEEECPFRVLAAKHMALLKLDLLNRMFTHYQITQHEFNTASAPLILAVQRINWHLRHLEAGEPTPPFSAYY